MTHEEMVNQFVERMRAAADTNLVSVILYGSAAEGEFHPEYSDLNLLCVVRDASFSSLAKIAEVMEWWRKQKHHPPHVLIEFGKAGRQHSLDAVKELGSKLNFDSSAFVQLIEVRAKKIDRKQLQATDLAARYLDGIEKVAATVDTMQSSSANT